MKHSILVAINDSMLSRSVLDYLIHLGLQPENQRVDLLHVLIRPKAEEELMGKKFATEKKQRMTEFLEQSRKKLIDSGFPAEAVDTILLSEDTTSVTEGILDQFKKERYDMVLIGRKKKSKSEEFVLGDISIKLVRALENTAVIVVKPD